MQLFEINGHYEICSSCKGCGAVEDIDSKYYREINCKRCRGTGKVYIFQPNYSIELPGDTDLTSEEITESFNKIQETFFTEKNKLESK